MSPTVWFLVGLFAIGVAVWAYLTREERVEGRVGPAVLRSLVIFLILGGLALPALGGRTVGTPQRVVLLDVSRSMSLPVRAGDPAAPSRLDSARREAERLRPDRIYLFGDTPRAARLDSISGVEATDDRSRLEPALQAARLGGADSVWVLTDGDLADREQALSTAEGLGLGIHEVRVAIGVPRVGLAAISAPERVRAGDTVRVIVEVRSGGDATGLSDSVSVELQLAGTAVAVARSETPAPGRTGRVELSFVPEDPDEDTAWQRYEAVLVDPVDPLSASDRVSTWMQISEATGGAVLVSTVPGWEARFLVPSLERLVLGGARGFLRLGDGRYLEITANPRIVEESRVRAALRGARLLVVQAKPAELPSWLETALRTHPRVMVFAEGPGSIPGTGVRATGPLPGEWYAMPPIPASPASALLREADLEPLPPVRELYALDPPGRWTILTASRNRRGEGRPILSAGESDGRRWAVSAASEWWRWALRGGAPRRVYDGVLSGIVGWLVEDATPRLVSLTGRPSAAQPPVWRIRPGAYDVEVRITDSQGAEVWSDSWVDPPARVTGPPLGLGLYEVRVTATGPEGAFEATRPIEIAADPREMLPSVVGEPVRLSAVVQARSSVEVRAPRPVWPFALAILLLCGEWIWRHRIGLR